MSQNSPRQRIFIDRPIQRALLVRVLLYWVVCLLTQVLLMVFVDVVISAPDEFYARAEQLRWHLQLTVIGSLVLLPLILMDVLRLSHRWVGPIFRLRTSLHAMSRNELVPPVRFREGDFWQELAGDLNVISAELSRLRAKTSADAATQSLPAAEAIGAAE